MVVAGLCFSFTADQDCGSDEFLELCAPNLGDHMFIKTFDFTSEKSGEEVQVKYILSKDSKYRFAICDQGSKMKVKLLDRNKKLIATNYVSGRYYEKLDFNCTATGVYYVEAKFKPGKEGCGVVILGFSK